MLSECRGFLEFRHPSDLSWSSCIVGSSPRYEKLKKPQLYLLTWFIAENYVAVGTGFNTLFRGVGTSIPGVVIPRALMISCRPSWRRSYFISHLPIQARSRASLKDLRSGCRGGNVGQIVSQDYQLMSSPANQENPTPSKARNLAPT